MYDSPGEDGTLYTMGDHQGRTRAIARTITQLTRPRRDYWHDCLPLSEAVSEVRQRFSRVRPKADAICWVPSHDASFGPSQSFADLLAELWGIPKAECLVRRRAIKSAHRSASRPSFGEQVTTIDGIAPATTTRVILVDNVVATGASLLAGKTVLEQAGLAVRMMCSLSVDYTALRSRSNERLLLDSYERISLIEL